MDRGGLKCRIGTQETAASIIKQESLVKCITPVPIDVTQNTEVEVLISIDGGLNYFGSHIDPDLDSPPTFTYLLAPTFTSLSQTTQTLNADYAIQVVGTGFNKDVVEGYLLCKF